MKKTVAWIMINLMLMTMVYGLAESSVPPAASPSAEVTITATPAPESSPEATLETATSPAPEATPSPAPAPTGVAFTKQLKRGSTGDLVKLLQTRLRDLGYYTGNISGNYLDNTKAAVAAFQKNNGLSADGVTGKDTWELMFNSKDALDVSATPRPTPTPAPAPYALTVDVTNQIITAYERDENGQYTKVVRRMICSTGTYSLPTTPGTYTLNGHRARFPLFTKYGCYVQYWTPIANGFGFHSVIYNTQNTMDLAVSTYTHLGTRASHGCIRMLVDDAKWIYENAKKGTVVTVTTKLPSDPELTQSLKPAALNRKNMLPKVTATPSPTPSYNGSLPPPTPLRSLSKGKKGTDVFWLQMKLKELGYYTGTVTGGYYGGTQKAVKAYQKDHNLTADGAAGLTTLQSIYEGVLPSPTPKITPTPKPTKTPKPTSTPKPTATPKPTTAK